jgi:hypothetical protein
MMQALVNKAFLKSETLKFFQNRVETSSKNNRTIGVTLKNPLLKAEVFTSPVLCQYGPIKLRIKINKIGKNLGREFKPLQRDLNEIMTDRAKGISKVKKCAMQHFLSFPCISQQLL